MKHLHDTAGYRTFDLSECRIHRIEEDGTVRFVALYPKKWKVLDEQPVLTMRGELVMRPYDVTDWEEVELEVKGK